MEPVLRSRIAQCPRLLAMTRGESYDADCGPPATAGPVLGASLESSVASVIVLMQAFSFCVALGPLAAYLFLLGVINLSRRPRVVSGFRETAALGLALSGFVVVGPMQLFMPEPAAAYFGSYVWGLLIGFYALTLVLAILLSKPRLVIFNLKGPQLRPVLAELALRLDGQARWAGDSLAMPQLGVQLHIDEFPSLRNVSLVATGDEQSFGGWRELELALRAELRRCEVPLNPPGLTLVICGLIMLGAILQKTLENPQALARGLFNMLRL